ncbi:MAG TPA: ABC transporter ATP-binding protein [Euryarchaeota archaeon]|nr:ABC transporter ATP-binding protein [Euryarchaeota archaeon]
MEEIIKLEEVKKTYLMGKVKVKALRGVNLTINRGDYVSIMGPSGSGKSTLLHLMGALDKPSSGKILIDGIDISRLKSNRLALLRRKKIGFVFQQFHLLQRLTALENVELPLWFAGVSKTMRTRRAKKLLERVGLGDGIYHRPGELSGGEMQMVSIARALANKPEIILADEPTGDMDSVSGKKTMEMLEELNSGGKTLVVVTHDREFGARAKRKIKIMDGIIEQEDSESLSSPGRKPAGRE